MKISKIILVSLLISSITYVKSDDLDELVFCFVGDTGEITETQRLVASSLAKSDCSMIWHTGDIIYPSGIENADDPEFLNKFLTPFNEILNNKIPFYLTLGNHDYKKNPSGYIEISKRNDLINYPNNFYTKQFGSLCFFALDTTIFDKLYLFYKRWGHINWLKSSVEELKESCKFSIAVAHHPLFSSGDRDKASPQLATFLESYVFGTFDIYITGHNHVLADEGDLKETKQLISATGSLPGGSPETTAEGRFNVETPGFLKLKMKNDSTAEYEFINAKEKTILWRNIKLGSGLRTN